MESLERNLGCWTVDYSVYAQITNTVSVVTRFQEEGKSGEDWARVHAINFPPSHHLFLNLQHLHITCVGILIFKRGLRIWIQKSKIFSLKALRTSTCDRQWEEHSTFHFWSCHLSGPILSPPWQWEQLKWLSALAAAPWKSTPLSPVRVKGGAGNIKSNKSKLIYAQIESCSQLEH